MEPESSDAPSRLPWIWFLECLAANKKVDYLTLRDVARKVPGLSGSAAMHARELLALRCLEGLAEMGNEVIDDATRCGSKIGLDLSRRCSVVLFRLTSEAVKSGSGLDGLDVSKWDIKSFVEHKRAQLPKCTLERLEEMIIEGKDPAAVSLREISGIKNVDHSGDKDMFEGVAKVVSTSHHQVTAGAPQIMNLIPENENGNKIQDSSKGVLLQKSLTGEGDGDVQSNIEMSVEDMHVGENRPQVVSDAGDKVPDQREVNSPLKEDGSDSGKKPQDNNIEIEKRFEQRGCDDQNVHTLRVNQKLSCSTPQALAAQTVLGEDFREEITLPADLDAPVTANCNQEQAVRPMADQIFITNSDRNHIFDDGPVSELVVKTSRDALESNREPSEVEDNPLDVEGYDNEDDDAANLKNNFMSSQCTAFDWTEPALCMKCNKSGPLLCCSANVCSVAVHQDCLGAEPCFDDSGSFRCPFCASSLATAEYLESKSRVGIRKRELDVFLSSNLSSKSPQRILNKKKRGNSKQDDMTYPMKGHDNEKKAETNREQPNQNVKHGDHICPEINGDSDVNPSHESPGACMDSDLPDREISNDVTGHVDLGVIVEPPILQVKDILRPRGKNITADIASCQPRDPCTQPPLTSEESEQQNSYAIVLYEGDKGYDKKDTISQNPPESKIKHVKPARNIPNIMISKPTSNVPYQSYPAYRRRKVPWTVEEEDKLREGVTRFHNSEAGGCIPWSQILEYGALVFQPCRTAENLKDKWRNICKKDK